MHAYAADMCTIYKKHAVDLERRHSRSVNVIVSHVVISCAPGDARGGCARVGCAVGSGRDRWRYSDYVEFL